MPCRSDPPDRARLILLPRIGIQLVQSRRVSQWCHSCHHTWRIRPTGNRGLDHVQAWTWHLCRHILSSYTDGARLRRGAVEGSVSLFSKPALECEGGTLENEPEGDPKAGEAQPPPAAPVIPEGKALDCQTTTADRDDKTEPSEEKIDRDLVRWTRALAIFTGVLVVASILQFWVMRGQLDEMKATREGGDKSMADQMAVMRDQAKAMQGQLAITQQEMADTRQTQRAFITVSDYVVTKASGDSGGNASCWNFQPVIVNAGGSPTMDMRYSTEVIYKIRPLPRRPGAANSLVSAPSDPDILFGVSLGPPACSGQSKLCQPYCLENIALPQMMSRTSLHPRPSTLAVRSITGIHSPDLPSM